MKTILTSLIWLNLIIAIPVFVEAQQSVARAWNEQLLQAIRLSTSRPTVHSRNLFHVSAAMYDAWAAYDDVASNYLLGKQVGAYYCEFAGIDAPQTEEALKSAREEAISYAAYRLLKYRFSGSPGVAEITADLDAQMLQLGFDTSRVTTDYSTGDPAALGNYIALSYIEFGLTDLSDEERNYAHDEAFYQPVNPPLVPTLHGNPDLVDLNHWQPLAIDLRNPRKFLSPQWGRVTPFALTEEDLTIYQKNGHDYLVYHDPGMPPIHDTSGTIGLEDYYKWNHALVAVWSGHLDPADGVMVDISPRSIGNLSTLPETAEEMKAFYHFIEGGVSDQGYPVNPVTGAPYTEQVVPLGDFARVLAEFWADGPNSETPPGHWFTILNYVSDHPDFVKRYEGTGEVLDELEWDIKAYFTLGGAMHDVAVSVWGIKSYYDFIRPISAIRGMSELGQSSDTNDLSYHPGGIPLVPGHIELVRDGDPLAGNSGEHIGKIKLLAWRGPDHLSDTTNAGVDWILAHDWWPYQKPSFITPPFAGYVSGHSTFSRAAAEVMTFLTGDEYFPGGMGTFDAPQNAYLIFEEGPSVDIQLQWAKYRDASDQASLSRLWGGIHPPIDDVPGRRIGQKIGPEAHAFAKSYFTGARDQTTAVNIPENYEKLMIRHFPNPVYDHATFAYTVKATAKVDIQIFDLQGKLVLNLDEGIKPPGAYTRDWTGVGQINSGGIYFYRLQIGPNRSEPRKLVSLQR